jgi:hypothetical protein
MTGKPKPLDIEREARPGKYADGGGLYLIVASETSKNWSYRYWINGKERWHGLGSFRDLSLKDARLARDAARLRVKGDRSAPGVDIARHSLTGCIASGQRKAPSPRQGLGRGEVTATVALSV